MCSPGCGLCAPRVHVAGTDASSLLAAPPRCLFPWTRCWVNPALALEQKEPAHIKCLFVQMECGVCVFVLRVSRVFKSLGATLSCPGVKPKHISRGAIRSLITPLHRSLSAFFSSLSFVSPDISLRLPSSLSSLLLLCCCLDVIHEAFTCVPPL